MTVSVAPLGAFTTLALTAYTEESLLRGALQLDHDRLADQLADGRPIRVASAASCRIADGAVDRLGATDLEQRDVLVIVVTGPAGNPARVIATTSRTAEVAIGPYELVGRIHLPYGLHPEVWARRKRWIALTGALITYPGLDGPRTEVHDTVLVNRELMDAFGPSDARTYDIRREAALNRDAMPLRDRMVWLRPVAGAQRGH